MSTIYQWMLGIKDFLWDYLLIFLLCGTGIYFTVRLRFVQIRKFKEGFKSVFGGFRLNGKAAGKEGMSSFQSLATAVAAQVGTGNIAGAATAIAAGGPGAIFWMYISAFFGMATIYSEATLAQKYKTRNEDGEVTGGPAYYIKKAFTGKFGTFLAGFFGISIILALGFMGNMVQSNSISDAFQNAFHIPAWVVGVLVALAAGFVFVGGVKRLASVTEKIVPVMAVLYVTGALFVIFMNYGNILPALKSVFVGAFQPQAVGGAAVGIAVKTAIQKGVARGLFSNEAGMGSTPHAHALAKVEHPCDQGAVAMVGLFIDTFVVLTMTALVILTSNTWKTTFLLGQGEVPDGAALAQSAFSDTLGNLGLYFIAVCMLFFAFSTIISWYTFGKINVQKMFGKKAVKIYSFIAIGFIFAGSLAKVSIVWELSDFFNALMVIPNLIGVLALSTVVCKLDRKHDELLKKRKAGDNIIRPDNGYDCCDKEMTS